MIKTRDNDDDDNNNYADYDDSTTDGSDVDESNGCRCG